MRGLHGQSAPGIVAEPGEQVVQRQEDLPRFAPGGVGQGREGEGGGHAAG
ncbi:hypothetical protein [Kitasatospora sp. NPDC087315]